MPVALQTSSASSTVTAMVASINHDCEICGQKHGGKCWGPLDSPERATNRAKFLALQKKKKKKKTVGVASVATVDADFDNND